LSIFFYLTPEYIFYNLGLSYL